MKLAESLEKLSSEIINGKNKYNFLVFSIETAGGKTYTSIQAMAKCNKKCLFVTKFKSEAIRVAEEINKISPNKAIAYTPDEKLAGTHCTNSFQTGLEYQNLIITHSTYINISSKINDKYKDWNKSIKNKFTTLIIDEEINPVKNSMVEYSMTNYYKWLDCVNYFSNQDLNQRFEGINSYLIGLINEKYNEPNQLHKVCLNIPIELVVEAKEELVNKIKDIDDELFKEYKENHGGEFTREILLAFIEKIHLIYSCLINSKAIIKPGKALYGYDYNFTYLMLENNIWLDASANFYTMYNLSDLFKVIKVDREIDHSNCKIEFHRINTSTTKKRNDLSIRDEITNHINSHYKDKSVLVLSNKQECRSLKEYIEEERLDNVKFLNFEEMRGVDRFKDFDVCYYAHTYRLTPAYYIFLYEYFSRMNLSDEEIVTSNRISLEKSEWGFDNLELHELMITDMASSMYQGLKRIQRNNKPNAIFEIWTKEIHSMLIFKHQLYGAKKNMEIEKELKRTKKDELFNYLIEEWNRKKVRSVDVRKKLSISEPTWKRIWKDKDFVNKLKERRIKQSYIGKEKCNFVIKY